MQEYDFKNLLSELENTYTNFSKMRITLEYLLGGMVYINYNEIVHHIFITCANDDIGIFTIRIPFTTFVRLSFKDLYNVILKQYYKQMILDFETLLILKRKEKK